MKHHLSKLITRVLLPIVFLSVIVNLTVTTPIYAQEASIKSFAPGAFAGTTPPSSWTQDGSVAWGTNIDFNYYINVPTAERTNFTFLITGNGGTAGRTTFNIRFDDDGKPICKDIPNGPGGGDINVLYDSNDASNKKPLCDISDSSDATAELWGKIHTGLLPPSDSARTYTITLEHESCTNDKCTDGATQTLGSFTVKKSQSAFIPAVTLKTQDAINSGAQPIQLLKNTGSTVTVVATGIDLRENKFTSLIIRPRTDGGGTGGYYSITFEPFTGNRGSCQRDRVDFAGQDEDWGTTQFCLVDTNIYTFSGTLRVDELMDVQQLRDDSNEQITIEVVLAASQDFTSAPLNENSKPSFVVLAKEPEKSSFSCSLITPATPLPGDDISVTLTGAVNTKEYSYQLGFSTPEDFFCGESGTIGQCLPQTFTIPSDASGTITLQVASDEETCSQIIQLGTKTQRDANTCFLCPKGFKPGGTLDNPFCFGQQITTDENGKVILRRSIALNKLNKIDVETGAEMEIQTDCAEGSCKNPGYGCNNPLPPPPGPPCLEYSIDGGVTSEIYDKENPPDQAYICTKTDTALIAGFATDPGGFVRQLLGFLLSISGGIALLLIIRSGYQMMTSTGNPEAIQEAKERITSAIVGLLFIIFSLVILQVIGVDILQIFPSV